MDPSPAALDRAGLNMNDPKQAALFRGRASLSGIHPKFTLVEDRGRFRPARIGDTSTHIAKFPSPRRDDLIENEYLRRSRRCCRSGPTVNRFERGNGNITLKSAFAILRIQGLLASG